MHAPLQVRDLGWEKWPSTVPVQVHFADKDPIRNQAVIDSLAQRVRSAGAEFPAVRILGTRPLRRSWNACYDAGAAELMFHRVLEFLESNKR